MIRCVAALLLLGAPAVFAQEQAVCTDSDREAYLLTISQAVTAVWNVPHTTRTLACTLLIKQNFRGEVLNVDIAKCGDDPSVHKSVIDAGYLASPLPLPDNKACFARDITVRIVSRTQETS